MEPLTAVTSWATPTSLFLLLNAVIGFIAVSSVFNSRKKDHPPEPEHHHQNYQIHYQEQPQRLVRAPSLFSRVTSFKFSGQSYGASFDESAQQTENRPLITPVPSFLSRMTSFNSLYLNRSVESETNPAPETDNDPVYRAPSLLARMASFNRFSAHKSEESEMNPPQPETDNEPVYQAPSLLARMASFNRFSANKSEESEPETERPPSLLSRMASINFSLHRSTEPATESAPVEASEQQVTRSATEPKIKKKKLPPAGGNKMKKPSSEKIEVKEEETASFGNGEVDAKADDFINRFKQQLRLQRLDSLLRYRNSAGGS